MRNQPTSFTPPRIYYTSIKTRVEHSHKLAQDMSKICRLQ